MERKGRHALALVEIEIQQQGPAPMGSMLGRLRNHLLGREHFTQRERLLLAGSGPWPNG